MTFQLNSELKLKGLTSKFGLLKTKLYTKVSMADVLTHELLEIKVYTEIKCKSLQHKSKMQDCVSIC